VISVSILASSQEWPKAEQGILDLRHLSISSKTYFKLDGEWGFYWKQFITPEDLNSSTPPEPTLYADVPSYWVDYQHPQFEFGGMGYASYHLQILLPERRPLELALDVPVFDVSTELFINNTKIHLRGKVGKSKENSIPAYNPKLVRITTESDTLSILVHVSNFHHRRGGFWKSMQLGHYSKISSAEHNYELISHVSLGFLAAFSLFFLCFFILYREDYLLLSFSMIVTGIFIRMVCTGSYPILLIFDLPWEWLIRLEYLGTYIAFGFGTWYFYQLFPAAYHKLASRINAVLIGISAIIVMIFEVRIFAYTMLYFQPAVLLFLSYYLIVCIFHIAKGKRKYIIILVGLSVFIAGLLNDLFIANSRTAFSKDYSIHFALQLFVFLQAILIIRTWIQAYQEKGQLMAEIEDINVNLEKRVDDRTEEINTRNVEIEARNRELHEALDFKSRVFSIIAHDLKSPVASLVQNSALLDLDLSGEEQEKLIKSFREQSRSSLNLIDNLLYWGRSQGSQLSVHRETFDMKDIVKEVLDPFVETARNKSILITDTYSGKTSAFIDKELIEIVIRNLISNAIKFTGEGGSIQVDVYSDNEPNKIIISIIDNGVGMSQEKIDSLFDNEEMLSTPGTDNEKGTGLGFRLCFDLLKVNRGELFITSEIGKGTALIVKLPVSKDQGKA
jgi:signal transduction histidine kinase